MNQLILTVLMLIQLESPLSDRAVGDGGRSHGCLQIGQAVLDDVNRVYGRAYTRADALDPARARTICALYLRHWGWAYERETGRQADCRTLARIWNGGPRGWEKRCTRSYGERAGNLMESYRPLDP